nr:type II secretion system protein GspL [Phytohalomonas tamaricis]
MTALLRSLPFGQLRWPASRRGDAGSSRPRLLLLCESPEPPATDTEHVAVHWIAMGLSGHDETGRIADSDVAALTRLTQLSQQHDSVLLLGATATSHFHLAAPKGLRQREWPLLIEDQLCTDGEALELAALQQGRDHLELLVTGRERILAWQRWLRERGIRTTHWASVFMAQPPPVSADEVSVIADTHHLMIKTLAAPPVLHAPPAERWLAWPREWQERLPAAIREKTWHWPWHDAAGNTPDMDSSELLQRYARHLPATLPAMPGIKPASRSLRRAPLVFSRTIRRMTAAIVGLALLHLGAVGWQGYLDQHALTDATQARLKGLLPNATGAPSLQRVQDRHAALQSLQQRNQWLTATLGHIDKQVRPLPLTLTQMSVTGTQLVMRWQLDEDATSDGYKLTEYLAGLGEAEWQPETQRVSLHVVLTAPRPEGRGFPIQREPDTDT